MNRTIFLLPLVLPFLFSCRDNDPNDGNQHETDSLIDVVVFMSYPETDGGLPFPTVIYAMLPDGSQTKVIMAVDRYAQLMPMTRPIIGRDGKTLFYTWLDGDSGDLHFLDLPSMRLIRRYDYPSFSVEGSFWPKDAKISQDMEEVYGMQYFAHDNQTIIVFNRQTEKMTSLRYEGTMEPVSLTMSGDQSVFLFTSAEEGRIHLNSLNITGRSPRRHVSLSESALPGSARIGAIPDTDRYVYAYRYAENGSQYLRLVRTDLSDSFSTVLEEVDHTGITRFSDRLSVSRDGNLVVYSYEDNLNGRDIEHIVIRRYENDALRNAYVVPTLSRLDSNRPPVMCVISKAIFDQLPKAETPFTVLDGRSAEP